MLVYKRKEDIMSKKYDVMISYISIILILVAPIYYTFKFFIIMIDINTNSFYLLISSFIIDILLVFKVFKIYYLENKD